MAPHFVFARSKTSADAVVRLTSDPLIAGLRQHGLAVSLVAPNDIGQDDADQWTVFHYDDRSVAEVLHRSLRRGRVCCLASDIYSFDDYVAIHDIVDLFLVPTDAHRRILSTQVLKPVLVQPEGLDPDAYLASTSEPGKRRFCWFGYPESFTKGMTTVVPVIEAAREQRIIDQFDLVTDGSFGDLGSFRVVEYAQPSFVATLRSYDYTILSHFALDLHVNSWIKSPNKLLTALFCGLVPLASASPAYEAILQRFGLEQFLFTSPTDLLQRLQSRDVGRDREAIQRSGIIETLLAERNPAELATIFLDNLQALASVDPALLTVGLRTIPDFKGREPLSFQDQLFALGPALIRAIGRRKARLR